MSPFINRVLREYSQLVTTKNKTGTIEGELAKLPILLKELSNTVTCINKARENNQLLLLDELPVSVANSVKKCINAINEVNVETSAVIENKYTDKDFNIEDFDI